jgi:hypothetical protein
MDTKKFIYMKIKIIVATVGVLGIGLGGYLWYNLQLQNSKNQNVASRLITSSLQSSSSASELSSSSSSSVSSIEILKKGSFVSLDPLHYASGNVQVEKLGNKLELVFDTNFATNPDGPDLYVWLVPTQKLGGAVNGVDAKNYLNLGALTNKKGAQKYSLTQAEYDKNNYAVVIWCQAFGVQFSNAILQ